MNMHQLSFTIWGDISSQWIELHVQLLPFKKVRFCFRFVNKNSIFNFSFLICFIGLCHYFNYLINLIFYLLFLLLPRSFSIYSKFVKGLFRISLMKLLIWNKIECNLKPSQSELCFFLSKNTRLEFYRFSFSKSLLFSISEVDKFAMIYLLYYQCCII